MEGKACRNGDTFIKRSNSMIFSRVESRNRSKDQNKNKINNSMKKKLQEPVSVTALRRRTGKVLSVLVD